MSNKVVVQSCDIWHSRSSMSVICVTGSLTSLKRKLLQLLRNDEIELNDRKEDFPSLAKKCKYLRDAFNDIGSIGELVSKSQLLLNYVSIQYVECV